MVVAVMKKWTECERYGLTWYRYWYINNMHV